MPLNLANRLEFDIHYILRNILKICLKVQNSTSYCSILFLEFEISKKQYINILIITFQLFQKSAISTPFVDVLLRDARYKRQFHFTLNSNVTHGAHNFCSLCNARLLLSVKKQGGISLLFRRCPFKILDRTLDYPV
jgi:hypothetical protein